MCRFTGYIFVALSLLVTLSQSNAFADQSKTKSNPLDDILHQLSGTGSSPGGFANSNSIDLSQADELDRAIDKLEYQIKLSEDAADIESEVLRQSNSQGSDIERENRKRAILRKFQSNILSRTGQVRSAKGLWRDCYNYDSGNPPSSYVNSQCRRMVGTLLESAQMLEMERQDLPLEIKAVDQGVARTDTRQIGAPLRNPYDKSSTDWW